MPTAVRPATRPERRGRGAAEPPPPSDPRSPLTRAGETPVRPATDATRAPVGADPAADAAKPRPATPQPAGAPAEQIALHIRKAAADGSTPQRLSLQLQPHELGRVEVRLDFGEDGAVRALVLCDRRDTLDLLQRDARGLERALANAGLKADSGGLNFSLRGEGQNGAFQQDGRDSGHSAARVPGAGDDRHIEVPAAVAAAYAAPSALGRLDIRI